MLNLLSFNAALLDIRVAGFSLYRPVDYINTRLDMLIHTLMKSDADILCLQEVFHYSNQSRICTALQSEYPFQCGMTGKWPSLRLGNELLVLSRFPLSASTLYRFTHAPVEELRHTSKGFIHVVLTLPERGKINLFNVHLSAGGKYAHPDSVEMNKIRARQIQQLLDNCARYEDVLLAGDFNTGPHSSTENYQAILNAGYQDLSRTVEDKSFTWDEKIRSLSVVWKSISHRSASTTFSLLRIWLPG